MGEPTRVSNCFGCVVADNMHMRAGLVEERSAEGRCKYQCSLGEVGRDCTIVGLANAIAEVYYHVRPEGRTNLFDRK